MVEEKPRKFVKKFVHAKTSMECARISTRGCLHVYIGAYV